MRRGSKYIVSPVSCKLTGGKQKNLCVCRYIYIYMHSLYPLPRYKYSSAYVVSHRCELYQYV